MAMHDVSILLWTLLKAPVQGPRAALTPGQEGQVNELLSRARELSDSGDYASASNILKRIEPMTIGYDENREILLLLSTNMEILGDLEGSQKYLGILIDRYPRSPKKILIKRAQILGMMNGRFDDSISLLRDIIGKDRSDPEAYCALAGLYHGKGNDGKAWETLREAEGKVGSRDVEASTMLSRTYRTVLGDNDSARRVSDSMYVRWKGKTYEYWLERAIIYLDLDLLKAEEALSKASSFRREDPQFHEAMAALLERKGLPDKARDQMKRARSLRWGEGSE